MLARGSGADEAMLVASYVASRSIEAVGCHNLPSAAAIGKVRPPGKTIPRRPNGSEDRLLLCARRSACACRDSTCSTTRLGTSAACHLIFGAGGRIPRSAFLNARRPILWI